MTPVFGPGVTHFATIDSTNSEAKRRFAAGDIAVPHWFLADQQTAGTGRRGRAWASPLGNFSGSVLLVPVGPPSEWHKLTYAVSLALYDALLACGVPGEALSLKWPNDVLLNSQKIAGILLETVGATGPQGLVIGVGVNLAAAPEAAFLDDGALPATSLAAALDLSVSTAELFAPLQGAFAARLAQSWPDWRQDWQARCTMMGKPVTFVRSSATQAGTATGLDEDGALLVRTPSGIERVLAGDVKVREV